MSVLCSRSAHNQNVPAQRPQLDRDGHHSNGESWAEMYLGQCAQLRINQAALYPVRQPRLPTSRRRSSPVKSTNRLPSSKPTNVRPNSQASWTAKLAVSLQPPALAQLGHGQVGSLRRFSLNRQNDALDSARA